MRLDCGGRNDGVIRSILWVTAAVCRPLLRVTCDRPSILGCNWIVTAYLPSTLATIPHFLFVGPRLPVSTSLLLLVVISALSINMSISGNSAVPTTPRHHTTRPMITGSSVLGIVYDGGVLLAADTLLSYGSLAKAQRVSRLAAIEGTNCVLGAGGEYSDFCKLKQILTQKALEETTTSLMDSLYAEGQTTGNPLTAQSIWNYLRMLLYSRRNRMNPFWNDVLVAGYDNGKPFLGSVDKIGTTVADNFLATGFASYLAIPLLREKYRPDLTEGEARALIEDCLRVLFYRDGRASSTVQLAKCDATGVLLSDPYDLQDLQWDAPDFVRPVGDLNGDGGW